MEPSALRILDANANRAREALRVVEDYTRFYLNHQPLCAELKGLRHDLTAATGPWLGDAILFRDTPGDVGTTVATLAEGARADLPAVVTAAGKRLGEALRTIEEYLKIDSPEAAARVESIRYRFYDIELRVARTLRPVNLFWDVELYVLITESACNLAWKDVVDAAIDGDVDCIQLREKELEGGELLERAIWVADRCQLAGVRFLVNDRPDIAVLAGADGVHVGQGDLPAAEARKIVGSGKIVGVSTHNIEQARRAVMDGADYIGVGPIFKSPTKPRDFVAGLEYATQIANEIKVPAVAIAGITEENLEQVLETGIGAVAVTAAVAGCDDPAGATRRMKQRIKEFKKRSAGNMTVGRTFLSAQKDLSENHPSSIAQEPGGVDILVCPSEPSDSPETSQSQSQPTKPSEAEKPPEYSQEFSKYERRLPHWRLSGATYFITFRVLRGELTPAERNIIMDHLKEGDPKYYELFTAVIMPDHVHLVLKPAPGVELWRIMKGAKGAAARKVNLTRQVRGHLWQDEAWDRIIRDQKEFQEKLDYCMNNPVRKKLVEQPWDYPWWYYKSDR